MADAHEHADDDHEGRAETDHEHGDPQADDEPTVDHEQASHGHDLRDHEGRVTAPMQPFSGRNVGVGLVVLAVGVAVAFVLPWLV